MLVCDCKKYEVIFRIYKEDGKEALVCGRCMKWWKNIDPTVTMILYDELDNLEFGRRT